MQYEKTVLLKADVATVWDALTNPEMTKQYFFDCEAISDWTVGSPLIFQTVDNGEATVHVKGVIQSIEFHRYLEHTCYAIENEDSPDEHTTVTYTFTAKDDNTELAVTQGPLPDKATVLHYNSSWDRVLVGLKNLLEGSGSCKA